MYVVDGRDRVVSIDLVPAPSPGAPLPVMLAGEHRAFLAYVVAEHDPNWDGTSPRTVDIESVESVALVEIEGLKSVMFGAPNDETLCGHPLWDRGLRHYGAFRVEHSSWLRGLEQINSVHPSHNPGLFDRLTHFIIAFHDSTFECVARSLRHELRREALADTIEEIVVRFRA